MEDLNDQSQPVRPRFLNVLAMLSLTGIILGIINNITLMAMGPAPKAEMLRLKKETFKLAQDLRDQGQDFAADMNEDLVMIRWHVNEQYLLNASLSLAVLVLGLIGVVYMLRGFRRGFHLYIIYNILSVLLIYISVPVQEVPLYFILLNFAFSGLFIWMYSRNLGYMTREN